MIRAQWDKLARLSCMTFGLKTNWDSISDGLNILGKFVDDNDKLHPWCIMHFRFFIDIAKERVAQDGWLKGFRDPLLHDVGQHSSGVAPHKKSIETTSEMWDKVCDEHNWLRERMMALLTSFISAKAPISK